MGMIARFLKTPLTLVVAVNLLLASISFSRVFPASFGWFLAWDNYAKDHLIYEEFFFPYPPVGLLLNGTIPNMFPNPIYSELVIEFFTWILAGTAIFLVTKLVFKPRIAAFVAIFASVAYYTRPIKLIAGYFEISWGFALLGIFGLYVGARKHSGIIIFVSGFALATSALTKQTFVVQNFIVVLTFLYFLNNSQESSRRNKYSIWVLLGWITPFFLVAVWAIQNNVLEAMLRNVLSGGGKEPSPAKIIEWSIGSGLALAPLWVPPVIILSILTLSKLDGSLTNKLQLEPLVFASWLGFLGIFIPTLLFTQVNASNFQIVALLSLSLALISGLIPVAKKQLMKYGWIYNPTSISIVTVVLLLVLLVISELGAQESYQSLKNFLVLFSIVWLSSLIFFWITRDWQWVQEKFKFEGIEAKFPLITIIGYSVGGFFVNSLSGGVDAENMVLLIGVSLGSLVSMIFIGKSLTTIRPILVSTTVLMVSSFLLSWIATPYTWWGLKHPSLISFPRGAPDVKNLEFLHLDQESQDFYNGFENSIQVAQEQNKDGEVFLGPQIPGLSLLSDINVVDSNCPVIWFDVCPEELAAEDFASLKSDPPEMIVWASPPEFVLVGHESAFRDAGTSSTIREIEIWLKEQEISGNYVSAFRSVFPGSPDQRDDIKVRDKGKRTSWILHVYTRNVGN